MGRFSGFPAHVERYIGRIRGAESSIAESGRDRGYSLVLCDHSDGEHVTVLTSGLRDRTAGAPLPQELLCTLRAENEVYAKHLVGVIAELLTESKSRVGYGALIMNDRVLLPDSEIAGALAAPHPYLDDEFDVLLDGDEPALQLITLIPIARSEAQLISRYGRDALYDKWEALDVNLVDLNRPIATE